MASTKITIPESLQIPEFERPPGLPATCTDAELIEAVKASLCGAGPEELAKMLHVPEFGVRYWVMSKEWNAIKAAVWPELKGIVHSELCSVRSAMISQLAERVRKGDPFYDNFGAFVGFRPVKARDLGFLLAQSTEVIHALEKEIGGIRDDEGQISLKDLAAGLKRYAQANDVTGESKRLPA